MCLPISFILSIQVLDLISSDNLNVPSEEEVYRAVLSWVKHDIDGRRQHVPWVRLVSRHLRGFLHIFLTMIFNNSITSLPFLTHHPCPPC